jgi:hypothetical protein
MGRVALDSRSDHERLFKAVRQANWNQLKLLETPDIRYSRIAPSFTNQTCVLPADLGMNTVIRQSALTTSKILTSTANGPAVQYNQHA